jgi:hypothetical protein
MNGETGLPHARIAGQVASGRVGRAVSAVKTTVNFDGPECFLEAAEPNSMNLNIRKRRLTFGKRNPIMTKVNILW